MNANSPSEEAKIAADGEYSICEDKQTVFYQTQVESIKGNVTVVNQSLQS